MTSIHLWSIMSQAIPWIGRYSLCKGVSYRIFNYFLEQMPIRESGSSQSEVFFSRAFRGRNHGLRMSVQSFRSIVLDTLEITYPWEFSTLGGGVLKIELWDRGRKINTRSIPWTMMCDASPTCERIFIDWGKRKTHMATRMVVLPASFIKCTRCAASGAEIAFYVHGRSFPFNICQHCNFIAASDVFLIPARPGRIPRSIYSLEQMGLPDHPIPTCASEMIQTMEYYQNMLRDCGDVQAPPPPKRRAPTKKSVAAKRHCASSVSGKEEDPIVIPD